MEKINIVIVDRDNKITFAVMKDCQFEHVVGHGHKMSWLKGHCHEDVSAQICAKIITLRL